MDNDKIGLLTGDEASNAFLNSPRNLQLQGQTLFWVDELGGTSVIQSVQTNGNSPTRVVHSPGQVVQLIVDASKEQLYWLNSTAGQISRCNLEGRQMEIGIIKGLRRPTSFALDSKKQKLFWAENDKSATGTISRGVLMSSDLPKSSIEEVSPDKIRTLEVDMYAVGMTFNPQEDQLAFIAAEKPLEGYIGHLSLIHI